MSEFKLKKIIVDEYNIHDKVIFEVVLDGKYLMELKRNIKSTETRQWLKEFFPDVEVEWK